MSDITKCKGEGCPLAGDCERFLAPDGFLQSYFMETPRKGGECKYLIPAKVKVKIIRKQWQQKNLN